LNRKNVKTLFCDKQFKKYPNSFALSTLSCGLLNDYLQHGKYSPERLKIANEYFGMSENKEKNLFLIY